VQTISERLIRLIFRSVGSETKILIVEDEAIIAMELESQLQGLGYEVTSIAYFR